MLFTPRKLVFAGGSTVVIVLVLSFFSVSRLRPRYAMTDTYMSPAAPALRQSGDDNYRPSYGRNNGGVDAFASKVAPPPTTPPPKISAYLTADIGEVSVRHRRQEDATRTNGAAEEQYADDEIDNSEHAVPTVPMIARVAGITLTTKEFDKTRARLEEILKRHGGYMGELKVSAPADAGRSLTATLRIPAQQLDAAMAELKKLGRVEDESQGGEEVTQQYVDLEARLANGKHTEQRLTEILRSAPANCRTC